MTMFCRSSPTETGQSPLSPMSIRLTCCARQEQVKLAMDVHCEKCDWMTGTSAGQNFHENRGKFHQKSSFNRSARWASAIPLPSGRERPKSMEQDVASDGERELKENRSLSLLAKVQKI